MIEVGQKLPKFSLPTSGANTADSTELRKRKLVVYFYPKDSTPGCTLEAQDFRDQFLAFRKAGVQVIGVSRDSVKSHDNFCAKQNLPFPLISDADETLCQAFGTIKDKMMYGRKVRGIERSTFLFDAQGVLRREWRGVKVAGHVDEVLAAAKSLL
jgi:thioredoxin-dependent peroxiredoxin